MNNMNNMKQCLNCHKYFEPQVSNNEKFCDFPCYKEYTKTLWRQEVLKQVDKITKDWKKPYNEIGIDH